MSYLENPRYLTRKGFQGLYQLMEKDVKVQVRDQDVELVKKSVDSAASEFKENVGQEVKIEVGGELSKDV